MLGFSGLESSLVIAGPTAIGKTSVALAMARRRPGRFEIISADSVQIYRRFDIGSAKPTTAERAGAPFHLVDIADPDEDFTLVDFQSAATDAISSILRRGNIPLIVGGTGLYIRSIVKGLGVPIAGPDTALRAELNQTAATFGSQALHERLLAIDQISAERIHQNDLKRIIRALEVFYLTGRPLSGWHQQDVARPRGRPLGYIVLNRDRDNLYQTIDKRVESMFAEGLLDEVAGLRKDGYSAALKPMTSVGYQQANAVFDCSLSLPDAIELTKAATRQYARRQLIWFRGEEVSDWIDVEENTADSIAEKILDLRDW
jgi:tRNA dimethylallyltransferase